ncbi:retrovirus-related Pol polyprotein from type-1 retrotransposable element R1 [Caerostris extrusa]|uniref:Retrovirus-related Pol polyprotein from type-1 retrotransposable element R1 n=1 Tax=Caerostris extrusa TaxID=172846 RepID=A0AAV4RY54_CAEEX|nr:retrovirus-related Pol polyprotein from type-1 retrotransposable element R1 [Caerostris extrusa]
MQVRFRMKARGSREHWVVEIDPIIRKSLVTSDESWQASRRNGSKITLNRFSATGMAIHKGSVWNRAMLLQVSGLYGMEMPTSKRGSFEGSNLGTVEDRKWGTLIYFSFKNRILIKGQVADLPLGWRTVLEENGSALITVSNPQLALLTRWTKGPSGKELDMLLDQIPCTHILVFTSPPTRIPLWEPDIEDHWSPEKEQHHVDLIIKHQLIIWNNPNSPTTFETTIGRSWIDITATSVTLDGYAQSWKVIQDTLSAHNYLCVHPRTNSDAARRARVHSKAIQTACTTRKTANTQEHRRVPWRDDELTNLRKQVRHDRRRFQRTRNPTERISRRETFFVTTSGDWKYSEVSGVTKAFPGAHGSPAEAASYCQKDGDFKEIKPKQRKQHLAVIRPGRERGTVFLRTGKASENCGPSLNTIVTQKLQSFVVTKQRTPEHVNQCMALHFYRTRLMKTLDDEQRYSVQKTEYAGNGNKNMEMPKKQYPMLNLKESVICVEELIHKTSSEGTFPMKSIC